RVLGTAEFPTTAGGDRAVLAWLRGHGRLVKVGVEGTGSYGAALARYLAAGGVDVVEVIRPNRQTRRRRGKSDAADAVAAVLAAQAVATQVASALLVTVGDNPTRLDSEAGFAALCGASPVDASSGKQRRHRLNRGGDRQANSALWRIVTIRMTRDPRTKAYVARRTAEGKTTKEIIRCLKRYVAREIYKALIANPARPAFPDSPV